jgi:hypothetical protein
MWISVKNGAFGCVVQQKPQNYKRAMLRYHRDLLGCVHEHAPVADLVLPCLASLLEFVS